MTDSIGKRIATARTTYRLSQAELAHNLGVTRAAISQYEQGKIRPRPLMIDRLAALFNADPDWFERGRGTAPSALDAPMKIPEVNVELLTGRPLDLEAARKWELPGGIFAGKIGDQIMVIVAPNRAGPIRRGDRVVIDMSRREGIGLALAISGAGIPVFRAASDLPEDAQIIGYAAAYLRTL
jgi:transcriptional regulator with XRE-family HTH domain